MLDQKDLVAIRNIMKEEISSSENRMINVMDEKIGASESRMMHAMDEKIGASEKKMMKKVETLIDHRLRASENMILEELDRVQEKLESRMDKMELTAVEVQRFYRTAKLEYDNTTYLMKAVTDLDTRVTALESCMA